MSVGYLCIIVLRNKPSDVGLTDIPDEDEIFYQEEKNKLHEELSSESDEEETENKASRLQQTKLMLKYPFFVSICLAYFLVQMIKTLYSDLSQIYLIKVVKIDPYKGINIKKHISNYVNTILIIFFSSISIVFLIKL